MTYRAMVGCSNTTMADSFWPRKSMSRLMATGNGRPVLYESEYVVQVEAQDSIVAKKKRGNVKTHWRTFLIRAACNESIPA